jgi:hypothetical protein
LKDVAPPSWRLSWLHPAATPDRTCIKLTKKLRAGCNRLRHSRLEAGATSRLPFQTATFTISSFFSRFSRALSFPCYSRAKFFAKILKTSVHIYREKKFLVPVMFFAKILRVL